MKYSIDEFIAAAEQELAEWKKEGEGRTDFDYEKLGFIREVAKRLQDQQPAFQQTHVTSSASFTWDDLAEAISKLPAEQRKKQVLISIEDESTFRKVEGLEQIDEDVYVNNYDNEDHGSLEDLKEVWSEDFKQEDYRLATPKGTPFLWDGF